jgi:hypothetical protein
VATIGLPVNRHSPIARDQQYVTPPPRCGPHFAKTAVAFLWRQMIMTKDNPATTRQSSDSCQQTAVIAGVAHQPEVGQVSGLDCGHRLSYSGVDG